MKMKMITQAVVLIVLSAFNAYSLEIQFGDTSRSWTGWGGGVCTWAHGTTDNSRDTIGTPNLLGGSVSVDEGRLDSVTFNYYNSANYGSITPGDLFIDLKADGFWDYVVDTSTRNIYSFAPGTFALGSNSIGPNNVSTKQGYVLSGDRDNYSLSGPNYQGVWTAPYAGTWDIRDDHPVLYDVNSGYASGILGYQASITPYFSPVVGPQTFTYAGLGLNLGDGIFNLAWTIDCANDVLYEKIVAPVPAPVPEPATMLLLGSGLLGLAGFRRKKD